MLKAISPSGLMLYLRSPEQFYMRYLSPRSPSREPSTTAMEVGTCFDILVKYLLSVDLDLEKQPDDISSYSKEAQAAGRHCLAAYTNCGAYGRIFDTLSKASEIRMEDKITRTLGGGAVISGYPDLSFVSSCGTPVITDWKVNGYCSNYNRSPNKGWLRLYSKPDRNWTVKEYHRDQAFTVTLGSVEISSAYGLEESYKDWAVQLNMYGWMLGYDSVITQIEQIVAKPGDPRPTLRVASHSSMSSSRFKKELLKLINEVWSRGKEHFFRELSREESDRKCRLLDNRAAFTHTTPTLHMVEL